MKKHNMFMNWKIQILKILILLKFTYIFFMKIPGGIFCRYEKKIIIKFIWKGKRTRVAKMILKELRKVEGTYCTVIVINCIKYINQLNRAENSEIALKQI